MRIQTFMAVAAIAFGGCGDNLPSTDIGDGDGDGDVDPPAMCSDICGTNSTCDMTDGAPTCSCIAGYDGDGTTAGSGCSNVNECEAGTDTCDPYSTCSDVVGSFDCSALLGFDTANNELLRLDPTTLEVVSSIPTRVLTDDGEVVGLKVLGLAAHDDGRVFASVETGAVRALAELDVATGHLRIIGEFAYRVGSLAFVNGVMYASTQDGSEIGATLVSVDLETAAFTDLMELGNGNDGTVIFWNPAEEKLFHFSGWTDRIVEEIDLESLTVTPLADHGADHKEVSGVVWMPEHGGMLAFNWGVPAIYQNDGSFTELDALDGRRSLKSPIRWTVPVAHTANQGAMSALGGDAIRLSGLELGRAAEAGIEVRFNGIAGTEIAVIDENTITAVTPGGKAGPVNIEVVTLGGDIGDETRREVTERVIHRYPGLLVFEPGPINNPGPLEGGLGRSARYANSSVASQSAKPAPTTRALRILSVGETRAVDEALLVADAGANRQMRGASVANLVGNIATNQSVELRNGAGEVLVMTAAELAATGLVVRRNKRGVVRARGIDGIGLQDVREISIR